MTMIRGGACVLATAVSLAAPTFAGAAQLPTLTTTSYTPVGGGAYDANVHGCGFIVPGATHGDNVTVFFQYDGELAFVDAAQAGGPVLTVRGRAPAACPGQLDFQVAIPCTINGQPAGPGLVTALDTETGEYAQVSYQFPACTPPSP